MSMSRRDRSDSNDAREYKRLQTEERLRDLERRAEASRKNNQPIPPVGRLDDGSNPSS